MKRVFVAGAVLLSMTGSLLAAEIEQIAGYYDWSGLHIGAHVGYGQVDVNGGYLNGTIEFGIEPSDAFMGGHADYNWQTGRRVLGVAADVSLAEWDDEQGPNAQSQFVSADLDWLATLRARLGFAIHNVLFFGSAGVAWANGEFTGDEDRSTQGTRSNADFEDFGLVAGGGIEWARSEAWSWRIEGLWINFDKSLDTTTLTTNSHPRDFVEFDDAWLIWTGASLHF